MRPDEFMINILPQPASLSLHGGQWVKRQKEHASGDVRIAIFAPPLLAPQVAVLKEFLEADQMFRVESVSSEEEADIVLSLSVEPHGGRSFSDERHRIAITPARIRIEAASPHGIAQGIQSLRQMLSGQRAQLALPCLIIEDEPCMAWRGMHLDSSRHFWDAATVRRFIDLLAFHKFNVFHWHLTDDQGWRLPVEGYPKLIGVAAWRDATMVGHDRDRATNPADGVRHGGFYSHAEIREVVAYAGARGIHVLPEVDVPGHVQALVAAYPEFGCAEDLAEVRQCWGISPYVLNLEPTTFQFLERVVETLAELFPFPFVHLGGDEAETAQWATSAGIQRRKQELGIDTDRGVQDYFTARLIAMLAAKGKGMVGWDEIMENGTPDAVTMFWRDEENSDRRLDLKALENGTGLVLANSSKTYFDHWQLPLEEVYAWDPFARIPENLRSGVLGAQGQLWTEYVPTRQHLDYTAFPRACALSQVLWTGADRESLQDFAGRLGTHLHRLDRLGVSYRPPNPATKPNL